MYSSKGALGFKLMAFLSIRWLLTGYIKQQKCGAKRLSGLRLWKAQDQINNSTLVSRSAELHHQTIRVTKVAFALDLVKFSRFQSKDKSKHFHLCLPPCDGNNKGMKKIVPRQLFVSNYMIPTILMPSFLFPSFMMIARLVMKPNSMISVALALFLIWYLSYRDWRTFLTSELVSLSPVCINCCSSFCIIVF